MHKSSLQFCFGCSLMLKLHCTDWLTDKSLYVFYLLMVTHPRTVAVLPTKNWVKFWLLLQSYRDIAWYVAGPHIFRKSVVRLELHQTGVRVATRCSLDSQPQCMFQAFFFEICYTVTLAEPGPGVIILESKVTATWKSYRNRRCHGNGYLCTTNYLHPTSCGVVIRLQHYVNECIFDYSIPQ